MSVPPTSTEHCIWLAPYTPLIFQGQEWAARTPFPFFTDHPGDVGANMARNRLRERLGTRVFLADRLHRIPGWESQVIDRIEFDELRAYARYGTGPTWPFVDAVTAIGVHACVVDPRKTKLKAADGHTLDAYVAEPAGKTLMRYASGASIGLSGPQGLPLYKPPYSRITAIDMNTGEHLWWIPFGETPAAIRNHPALQGMNLPNMGGGGTAITSVRFAGTTRGLETRVVPEAGFALVHGVANANSTPGFVSLVRSRQTIAKITNPLSSWIHQGSK